MAKSVSKYHFSHCTIRIRAPFFVSSTQPLLSSVFFYIDIPRCRLFSALRVGRRMQMVLCSPYKMHIPAVPPRGGQVRRIFHPWAMVLILTRLSLGSQYKQGQFQFAISLILSLPTSIQCLSFSLQRAQIYSPIWRLKYSWKKGGRERKRETEQTGILAG